MFVFGTDPEDGGGYADLANRVKHPNWYPDYLTKVGEEFGQPYLLHDFKGLNQPREIWDSSAPSDHVYGFNNWLLREYDSLDRFAPSVAVTVNRPVEEGRRRRSFYCYNYHDVPPDFNPDPRYSSDDRQLPETSRPR